jgi:hypothetical protein
MKKAVFFFSCFGLIGCAHRPQAIETVSLPYAPELVREVQSNVTRIPASINLEEKSPRRVYFKALYHQYLTLSKHLNVKPAISFCPQFHHDRIETDSSMIPTFSFYTNSTISSEKKEFFPELVFNRNFSLKDHHHVMKKELKVLCEDGVSDNYYKFDNLITHYAHKKSFHSHPSAMSSVLKIPVFANFYLLKMLQGQQSVLQEEKEMFSLTQTHWFEKYVAEASRMRNNFIRNKMVKR